MGGDSVDDGGVRGGAGGDWSHLGSELPSKKFTKTNAAGSWSH